MEKQVIRKVIRECLDEIFCEAQDFMMDEMAYPTNFNPEEFKNIMSFAGKQRYATQHLLGKIGVGSGRAVFRIDDEKVLKVALNERGRAQNDAESWAYKQNYDVVARVFDVDNDDMWIEMELAKKITPRRFRELTGTSPEEVSAWMANIQGKVGWGMPGRDLSENEFAYDLNQFTEDFQYPLPGDFSRISTYGEVLRDGVPRVVVVDFGFDSKTSDAYSFSQDSRVKKYAY